MALISITNRGLEEFPQLHPHHIWNRAAKLDRAADLWLSVGRHDRAETLSRAAEAMREATECSAR